MTAAFTPISKQYASWPTNIIGDTDLTLTNSAAARFFVSEQEGFNLTSVVMYLKHDPANGPVIMEVYGGDSPIKKNLLYAQEYSHYANIEGNAYITLDEQLYFEPGSTFWVVFHVPAGNRFPLGIGFEVEPSFSDNCFMSFDMGATWAPLEGLINDDRFAWAISANSDNQHLGNYLNLDPGSGDVAGFEQTTANLTADGSTLVNGDYSAYLILKSNDAANQQLRVPVQLNVSGQKPMLKHTSIADYGAVFVGEQKYLELVIENAGYGNFNDPMFSTSNPAFELEPYMPWQIKAREQVTIKVTFKPTAPGNTNGILTITNGNQTYEIALFGVGAETSRMTLTPEIQSVGDLAIGDEVTAKVSIENTGKFPLKYFIPGYDTKGVSDNWPSSFHNYGYSVRSNDATEANPIAYEFKDISTTGVKITESIVDAGAYFTLDMGFQFPYYGELMQTLYIANKGFTTFDNSVRPINSPSLNNPWNPKGFVSILGTHLSYVSQGDVFYQVEPDRVIVQYHNVNDGWTWGMNITAQIVYNANGDIRFYYEDLTMDEFNKQYLVVLIENLAQNDGIMVNNYENPRSMYTGLALGFDYPGPAIISSIQNGSGVLVPGSSTEVEIKLSTATLPEGTVNRYINFISNDPENRQQNALIQLDITSGGSAAPVASADTVKFGNVFQGAIRSFPFTIKNPGTARLYVTGMSFANNNFNLVGDQPTEVAPGLFKSYAIQVPTADLAELEDWLSIDYADGTHDTIYVTAAVVDAPAIEVDLSPISQTLEFGENASHPFTIENTGKAPLQVAPAGGLWLDFDSEIAPSNSVVDFTYTFEKFNKGEVYQWIDIRRTGTQMDFINFDDYDGTFWRELELPFPVEFYGQLYDSFKIGDNGLISFEDDPQASFFTDNLPTPNHGRAIMPYWTFSGFSDYRHPKEDIGIFYQFFDDKIIITWSTFINNFGGMGDPVSAQVIFYKNGTMKFQYKREDGGADATSQNSVVGLQRSPTDGVAISLYQPLDHGDGLAYVVVPNKRYTIAPGSTLAGNINIDASRVFGGYYQQDLNIHTNVPNSELLKKPVELTVTGDPQVVLADTIKFGSRLVGIENSEPVIYTMDVVIENKGAAAFDLTYANMADGTGPLNLMIEVQGFWGPEWTRIDYLWFWPTFTIRPGDRMVARAIFYPSEEGEFTDEVVFHTSIGEHRLVLQGTAYEPAKIRVATDPIHVSMVSPRNVTRKIALDNIEGKSNLDYTATVDYLRPMGTARTENLAVNSSVALPLSAANVGTSTTSVAKATAEYNRVLTHTDKEAPDTFIGTGGSAPFTLSTKFNAGAEGFNLSHIETFFRTEGLTSAVIDVEIRAGGTSVANAALLTTGSLVVTGDGSDSGGAWHQVALAKAVGIYPNEDFYVVVTYPLGIQFPQGTITDAETVPGRYAFYVQGQWYEVQEGEFSKAGWLMFAAEMEPASFTWLSIADGKAGTLAKGDSAEVTLDFDGSFANPGLQSAHIVFRSNDPANPTVRVPVSLHMNEAPNFLGAPSSIAVAENNTDTIKFRVTDPEGDVVTVAATQSRDFVTFSFAADTVTLVFAPDFGDKGVFDLKLKATDQYNAVREISLPVEILHTNRAPALVGDIEDFAFLKPGSILEYNLADYFADPDGDEFTYSVSSSNESVLIVFASASKFIIRTAIEGPATITFNLTDKHGATKQVDIPVRVDLINSLEDLDQLFSLTVYPNPTTGFVRIRVKGEIRSSYSVRVISTQGYTLLKKDEVDAKDETVIDLRALPKGVYLMEVTDMRGKSIRRIIKE